MDRRNFLESGVSAALAAALPPDRKLMWSEAAVASPVNASSPEPVHARLATDRHRFGLNYTPSHNWWFCWNDWNADPIKRDLDKIATLGADHLRIMLIWPFFQPNPTWVSPAHLERLSQLLSLMEERHLDALVTVFTGQLSGLYFLPPFNKPDPALYTGAEIWSAQELMVRELARTMKPHGNIVGFDFGNEMNTCWTAPLEAGDAWMGKMFALMNEALPGCVHVNGVDHNPWFQPATFSPRALAANPLPVIHAYPWWAQALKYGGPMDPPSTRLLVAMATLVRSYACSAKKPVWAGEFNTCIEALPEKGQAQWLETAVTAAIDAGVSWFTYWDSHDVDRKFGVLTNDGRVKEQGKAFKRLADAYRGKPVAFPAAAPPPPPAEHSFDATWKWMLDLLEWKPRG